MEANGMGGGILGGMASGMLGLDMPLHQHQQQQLLVSFATDHHSQSQQQQHPKHHFTLNHSRGKQQQQQQQHHHQQLTAVSDEEEQDGDTQSGGIGKRAGGSPWQRMKWTDNMVRLLILMVYHVGDDCGAMADAEPSGKKKVSAGGSGGLLQKKGKWKSVSRAMMEKGFYVSPQQCEDKFNDLNKRYKRVNDILGKGTACRVVENQSLLDTMDQLSSKMKEEVRKLLNSKHLFFQEMCAYHSSCVANAVAASPDLSSQPQQQQQRCLHSSDAIVMSAARRERGGKEEEEEERGDAEEGDDEDDYEDDDDEEEDEEEIEDGVRGGIISSEQRGCHGQEEDKGHVSMAPSSSKRQRPWTSASTAAMQQLSCELMGVMQDGTKSPWEQRQWLRSRVVQLEEQQVGYECQAFELEKQRFKWLKFSGKKERELERLKLDNERMRLENERMVLLLRHKELELDLHSKRPDHPSSITTG